eukprot:2137302-Prymnesium_polylepis.3
MPPLHSLFCAGAGVRRVSVAELQEVARGDEQPRPHPQAALTPALESRVHLLCDPLVPFSRHRLRCAQENAQVSYYSVVTVDCLPCIACSKVRTINPTGRQVSAATKPTHAHPVSLLPRVKRARPFLVST